ncbi:MAG: hypothetical protein JOZ15_13670, partial [Acidobacteria bacterium]|nr:hypothetical protein [Acidobacteriota bacterium]
MTDPDRQEVLDLLGRIRRSPLGERLILGGSSGVYGVSATLPALTEDVDLLVDAEWLAAHQDEVLSQMRRLGFEHQPGSPTFVAAGGLSVDLVGYSLSDRHDRIGGGTSLPVMVFSDLGLLLSRKGSTIELPDGGRALSPVALVVAKLLTVRLEKGSKDKLQALLVIDERSGDDRFLGELRELLQVFPPERLEDALADAQAACLAVAGDVALAGAQAAGYAGMRSAIDRGLR